MILSKIFEGLGGLTKDLITVTGDALEGIIEAPSNFLEGYKTGLITKTDDEPTETEVPSRDR